MTTVRWPRLKDENDAYPLQQKRGRYGEVGDVESWPSAEVNLIGRIFKTSRTVHQYKEVSVQFIRSFSGNIIILAVTRREERY